MKLEFLDDISEGGKYRDVVSERLVRLFDFGPTEASMFSDAIQNTIIAENIDLRLSSLNFIEPVNCNLVFKIW